MVLSGSPGSERRILWGSSGRCWIFCQMLSSGSRRPMVLPKDLLILALPSIPGTRGLGVEEGLGFGEGLPEEVVEAAGDLPGELDVLHLVLPHGDGVRLVDEDVRRLEHGVQEEAGPHGLLLAGLVLELGHAGEVPQGGEGGEDPGELGVLGHVGLDEEGDPLGVKPRRHVDQGGLKGALGQGGGVVGEGVGEGVVVHDAEEGFPPQLFPDLHPLLDGPQVVADVDFPRGLDAGEDPFHYLPG